MWKSNACAFEVVLKEIERDMPVFVQGHNFAVHMGSGWESFAGTSDMRELLCEKVSSP
jgi:hypothetical protein